MPARHDPLRRCLPIEAWPQIDRSAWEQALRPGRLFEEPGRAAHRAEATRVSNIRTYGRWLSFLDHNGGLDPPIHPGDRVRPEIVERYIDLLRQQLAPLTVWTYLANLHAMMIAMAPQQDWSWLRRVVNRLQRQAVPVRNIEPRLKPSGVLYQSGLKLMRQASSRRPRLRTDQASWYRDGLMLALRAARPLLRPRSFASIRIGHHLIRAAEGYRICFDPEETKTRRRVDELIGAELSACIDLYLECYRLLLLQGNSSDRLWISNQGRPMPQSSIAHRICKVTRRLFGQPISPHLFRHCAGTTIADELPEQVGIVTPVLGHASFSTSERYYIEARALHASRRHQASLDQLRRRLCRRDGDFVGRLAPTFGNVEREEHPSVPLDVGRLLPGQRDAFGDGPRFRFFLGLIVRVGEPAQPLPLFEGLLACFQQRVIEAFLLAAERLVTGEVHREVRMLRDLPGFLDVPSGIGHGLKGVIEPCMLSGLRHGGRWDGAEGCVHARAWLEGAVEACRPPAGCREAAE